MLKHFETLSGTNDEPVHVRVCSKRLKSTHPTSIIIMQHSTGAKSKLRLQTSFIAAIHEFLMRKVNANATHG